MKEHAGEVKGGRVGQKESSAGFQHSADLCKGIPDGGKMVQCISCDDQIKLLILKRKFHSAVADKMKVFQAIRCGSLPVLLQCFFNNIQAGDLCIRVFFRNGEGKIPGSGS